MNSLTRQVDSGRAPLVIVPPPLTYRLLSRLHLSRRDIARLCSCVCVRLHLYALWIVPLLVFVLNCLLFLLLLFILFSSPLNVSESL